MLENSHHLPIDQVLAQLDATTKGLSTTEATARLVRDGKNRLQPPPKRHPLMRLALQFHHVLIYLLIGSASVTALLGHFVDTAVIIGVVFINALIGFLQEGKAEKSLEAIRNLLSVSATVLRDGVRQEINAEELVVGDVVFLASGDKVPADMRLLEARNLRIEEASLTGESEPIEKSLDKVAQNAIVGDRKNMVFLGTLVVMGYGKAMVTATGDHSEIGRIGHLLAQIKPGQTPLMEQMTQFGRWLTAVILLLAVLTLIFGMVVHGAPLADMLLAAVGLAVAAIPEGLPAIMTITLAIGVQRMAAKNAIIRKMPAVETLGAITVICSDKTGTLTKNEMTVEKIICAHATIQVSGVGYAPKGGFTAVDEAGNLQEINLEQRHWPLRELANIALHCNEARLFERDGEWTINGDPTEGALLTMALKTGLDPHFEHEVLPRTDTIPFESEHRFMATLHHDHQGNAMLMVKGAPEEMLAKCTHQWQPITASANGQQSNTLSTPINLPYWHSQINALAKEGYRVLGLAMKNLAECASAQRTLNFVDVSGLQLIGLAAIIDPPREEAIRAVAECHRAGIRVKMITGDHALTAGAIAKSMGLKVINTEEGVTRAVTGEEIESMDDAALRLIVREVDVFARASPEDKLRLVAALEENGEVVAMTGDGVNDAPALKRSAVGVAMGKKGTEAAKEAAEMVLTDDNFASISAAVREGRTVYDNLRKAVVYVLPTSMGQAAIVLIAVLCGWTLPISPVQILWVNMVTAVTLSLAIAFEHPEADIMQRPPRKRHDPLLNGFMLWRVVFVMTLFAIFAIGSFNLAQQMGYELAVARTIAVNVLVVGQVAYLFNCRRLHQSVLSWDGLLGNRIAIYAVGLLIVLQGLFTHWGVMQLLFGSSSINLGAWAGIGMVGVIIFFVIEMEKRFWRS
jgi:magnesium-transporting ATPase (P-type)